MVEGSGGEWRGVEGGGGGRVKGVPFPADRRVPCGNHRSTRRQTLSMTAHQRVIMSPAGCLCSRRASHPTAPASRLRSRSSFRLSFPTRSKPVRPTRHRHHHHNKKSCCQSSVCYSSVETPSPWLSLTSQPFSSTSKHTLVTVSLRLSFPSRSKPLRPTTTTTTTRTIVNRPHVTTQRRLMAPGSL